MSRTLLLVAFVALLLTLSRSSMAQGSTSVSSDSSHLPPLVVQGQGMNTPAVTSDDQVSQQLLQNYRKQRQVELLRDAAKLHELSGELQEYLDKNGSTILSIDMLKKAEAVEKLAHSVRTKMKEMR